MPRCETSPVYVNARETGDAVLGRLVCNAARSIARVSSRQAEHGECRVGRRGGEGQHRENRQTYLMGAADQSKTAVLPAGAALAGFDPGGPLAFLTLSSSTMFPSTIRTMPRKLTRPGVVLAQAIGSSCPRSCCAVLNA